jgi:arginase family enzyme
MTERTTGSRIGIPTLLGIPFDGQSSYLRGAGDGPPKIREAIHCDASNEWTESGVDVGAVGAFDDAGDLAFSENNAFEVIESGIGKMLAEGRRPVSLGGDHSITYPIVKVLAQKYPELTIFHFDAHPDLYDEFE